MLFTLQDNQLNLVDDTNSKNLKHMKIPVHRLKAKRKVTIATISLEISIKLKKEK